MRVTQKTYMSVGVMKDYKLKLRDLHVSHTFGCVGTRTPKHSDEVNRRECDGLESVN